MNLHHISMKIIQRTKWGKVVLIGDSLGGTVSFMTALMYPHTFGKVIMQSPFVDETVMNLAKTSKSGGAGALSHYWDRRNSCKAH